MIRGNAKFDGIAVGELSVNFMGPTVKATAKAAFVATGSGATHGWTTNESWSPETMSRLRELRAQMEVDLAKIHFGEDGLAVGEAPGQSPGGLGEHLAAAEGRSI